MSIVHYIAGDSGWMFSLVAMLFAGCASFFEIWYGGMAARREERTMRRRLLQAVFASSSSRDDEFSEFSSGNLVALHTDNVERVAELAERVGRSRSHIANMVRLLKLESHIREYLANGSLTMGQARPLLGLEDPTLQREAADIIMTREYSARQAEELVKRMQKEIKEAKEAKEPKDAETPVESQTIFLQKTEDRKSVV